MTAEMNEWMNEIHIALKFIIIEILFINDM